MIARRIVQALCGTLAATLLAGASLASELPDTPEPGPVRMGLEPWLGYGQWHIADKQDLFKAAGLDDVVLVNFSTDAAIDTALAAGELDAANVATHKAMAFVAAGLDVRIVALLDVSTMGDAIIAAPPIALVTDLDGKRIAYEPGSTGDILLQYALTRNGLSIDDVTPVPLEAAEAGKALVEGKVPVAITYEPYLSLARNGDDTIETVFTAGAEPGLISDVLVVREDFAAARPGAVVALLKSWQASLDFYEADLARGRAIIAEAVGADPKALKTAFDGVVFYSLGQNRKVLTGSFLTDIIPNVEDAAVGAGLLDGPVDMRRAVDGSFVKKALEP
ncbi:ABC transporter substrate-binding protein [Hoeflea poritis]|uniref:ABC transporter substrate-binding protein n=1 Tax=Hoeflea poritis TaxID=2993659 RepID=A0ABT4VUM5_9HYPH|nr:ABC transporter substrate-binding protein [Hoeflea poritis]MDA4848418.1 ABC transporter substrate-binding protein [Hoeflea poritis]